ncbi:hypothetical protein FI667_g6005, partial [Globisporangium splendens]
MDELAKWSFAAPWCAHLRGRMAVEKRACPRSLRSSYAWLRVPLPADGKGDNWRRIQWCREAVELLGTIALFDADAFRMLLVEKCMLQVDHGLDVHVLQPRFSFVFSQYMNLDISWGSTLYNQFFLALDHESMSDEFRDAMDQVRRIRDASAASTSPATSHGRESRSDARIPVQITFQPPELPPHWSVQYLKSVLETVHAIRDESDCSTSGGDRAFPFALESVCLNVNQVTLSKKAVEVLRELLAAGVQIPLLSLHPSTAIAKAPRDCMGEFISTLTRCALDPTPIPYAADANDPMDAMLNPGCRDSSDALLRVRGPGVDSQQFGAFCSALASSNGIQGVHLSNVFAEERGYHRFRKWQWTAYAFFWQESTSQISALRIDDTCLRQEDVLAISSILSAKYPAKQLLGREIHSGLTNNHPEDGDDNPNDGDDEIVSVLVNKDARIDIDPDDPYGRKSFTLDSEDHFLVMKDDETCEFVDILVPGYAHCAVERESIQYYLRDSKGTVAVPPCLKDAAREAPSVDRCITSLDVEFKEAVQAEILQAFIELVGPPLASLVLKVRTLSSESLGAILISCPRLKRLTIDIVEENSLGILAQAYEDGVCTISSLSLQGLELDSDEVTDFAQALGNKESVLAKTLEELSVGECIESYALDEANLSALLAMLETNTKIEYLELYVESALYDNFLPLFKEFHGQELPVMKESMPLACRFAFVSVIQHFNNTEEDSHARLHSSDEAQRAAKKARRQSTSSNVSTAGLDRHVVSLIFQFAAIPKKRVVRLINFH